MDRPTISQYDNPAEFVRDMIRFRKNTEDGFSVYQATKKLRKVSPALVSLVIQGKRNLTLDRADEFAKLLNLNVSEKVFFRNWLGRLEDKDFLEASVGEAVDSRKAVAVNLLTDWLNVYVKDFFQIPSVQKDPSLIEKHMMAVAPPRRIQRAIQFLLREGYLRKTLEGEVVLDTRLAVAETKVPSRKIRQFHKGALGMAKLALDLYPPTERLANTLIIPLNEPRHQELRAIVEEFAEKIKDFAARDGEAGDRLYQVIVNLSLVGGKLE